MIKRVKYDKVKSNISENKINIHQALRRVVHDFNSDEKWCNSKMSLSLINLHCFMILYQLPLSPNEKKSVQKVTRDNNSYNFLIRGDETGGVTFIHV